MEDQCRLAEVSRAGFYRQLKEQAPRQEEVTLRDRLQQIVVERRQRIGHRPITKQLQVEGWAVNRKRVLRLMREDNLLCLMKRKFVLTTESKHDWPIYRNLIRGLEINRVNRVWVADITYIRLRSEFVFLAVVLDVYSRRVIGWELADHLRAELAIGALRKALDGRSWKPGELIHHSDRGVQYACSEYRELLAGKQIDISMSRSGNPYDNARAERFMRTLKQEEVYASQYKDLEDARAKIGEFIEKVYNSKRLHAALGYESPAAFEAAKGAVETDGADGKGWKTTNRFPTPSHSSLEIPAGFPQFPPPVTTVL